MLYELTIHEYEDTQTLGVFKTREEARMALGDYVLENDPGYLLYPAITEIDGEMCAWPDGCTDMALYAIYALGTPSVKHPRCVMHYVSTLRNAEMRGVKTGTEQLPVF